MKRRLEEIMSEVTEDCLLTSTDLSEVGFLGFLYFE